MKGLILSAMVLVSIPAFACRIDIDAVNNEVLYHVTESLGLSDKEVVSQKLLYSKDIYPQVRTSSCPDATLFFHSFFVNKDDKKCEVLTKFKMTYSRVEISPFRVLDIDCH